MRRNIPPLKQTYSLPIYSPRQDSFDENVLEQPSGSFEYQLQGRHRDQRMRMDDQEFDPRRWSSFDAEPEVLEHPTGSTKFQLLGRHRDQRMRMGDQEFDPIRYGYLWGSKDYEDFPGNVNYPRGEKLVIVRAFEDLYYV